MRLSRTERVRHFGEARADAVLAEAKAVREGLADAATLTDYGSLAREAEHLQRTLGIKAHAVSRAERRQSIGHDYYQAAKSGWISAACIRGSSTLACCA